jgi:hypothetical protein
LSLPFNGPLGPAQIREQLKLLGEIKCPQITADQNDYSPSGLTLSTVLNISSDAARNITGLGGGSKGRVVVIYNSGAFAITLVAASASSQIQNQFSFPCNYQISAGAGIVIFYDGIARRWRMLDEGFGILAFGAANAAFTVANSAVINAASAFGTANSAVSNAAAAYSAANAAFTVANSAVINAASAFGTANSAVSNAAAAYSAANAVFVVANSVVINAASAFGTANAAAVQAQLGRDRANAAFSNVYITNVSAGLNFTQNVGSIVATSLTSNVVRWVQGTGVILSVDSGNNAIKLDISSSAASDSVARDHANLAHDTANGAYTTANGSFARANASLNNVHITNTGVYSWTQNVGAFTATANQWLKLVQGTGVVFDIDAGNNAVRINASAGVAGGDPAPAYDRANAKVVVSNTTPTFLANTLWWHSDTGLLYLAYTDANTNQWIDVSSGLAPAVANTIDVWQAAQEKVLAANIINSASQLVTVTANSTNVVLDWQTGFNFFWHANANSTISTPTNPIPGTWRTITITQNVTSPKTLTFSSNTTLKTPGGSFAGLTATANAVDQISIFCMNTTTFFVTINQGYS